MSKEINFGNEKIIVGLITDSDNKPFGLRLETYWNFIAKGAEDLFEIINSQQLPLYAMGNRSEAYGRAASPAVLSLGYNQKGNQRTLCIRGSLSSFNRLTMRRMMVK